MTRRDDLAPPCCGLEQSMGARRRQLDRSQWWRLAGRVAVLLLAAMAVLSFALWLGVRAGDREAEHPPYDERK